MSNEEVQQEFEAGIEQSALKDALNSVSVLVDECKIRLNEGGLNIRAVDPANVGMVDLHLDAPSFETYQAGGGVIGVNLDRLEKIVKFGNSGDIVEFDLNHETRKLNIYIDGMSYTLALIDPDSIRQEPDIPDLALPVELSISSTQLNRGVKAADMVSDHVRLRTDGLEEAFYIEAEGDTDDVDLKLDEDDVAFGQMSTVTSLYSLEYLKNMNKAIPKGTDLEFLLGDEFPVKISYEINDGHGNVQYMLAPRIESN